MDAVPDDLALDPAALASTVHELRNPVSIVYGFADLLERQWDTADPADLRHMVRTLRRNSSRLLRLIEDILVLSRYEADMPPAVIEDAELREVLVAAADIAIAHGGTVDVRCSDTVMMRTDADRVEQIVGTLVDNAFRHGRPPVVVTGNVHHGLVSIVVHDSGQGVAAANVQSLFDRFSPLARPTGSNGLGLHTARRIARSLHGDLVYRAVGNGHGGSFALTVPTLGP